MKASISLLVLGFFGAGALAQQQCAGSVWYLEPDDCICMNSRNGTLLRTQTLGCCKTLGYKTYDNICAVDRNMRQSFKDCCKGLDQESVIGHCR